jgi:hypothetical protein
MAVSSRRILLPRKSEKIISGWWLLAGFAVLFGSLCFFKVGRAVLVCLIILAALTYTAALLENRRIRKIAQQRQEDSICTFAKSFDCRTVDTKIIRATHEELQLYHSFATPSFPIRSSDSFEKDLKLDDGDLDDIAFEIARRTQRSMENSEQNPLHGKVRTVADLVLFLNHQPLLQDALQGKQV